MRMTFAPAHYGKVKKGVYEYCEWRGVSIAPVVDRCLPDIITNIEGMRKLDKKLTEKVTRNKYGYYEFAGRLSKTGAKAL